jgi:hypothetical protein
MEYLYAEYIIFSNKNEKSVKNIIQIYLLNGFCVSENTIFVDG